MAGGPPSDDLQSRTRATATGVAAAALVVAAGLLTASTPRAPLFGDGVWTTPMLAIVGGAGVIGVIGAVLAVRAWPRGPGRDRGAARQRWATLVLAAVVVAVVAWLRGTDDPAERAAGGGFDLGPLEGLAPEGLEPLATTPTAIAGGLVFFAAIVLLLLLLATRWLRRRPAPAARRAAQAAAAGSVTVGDGSPEQVVLTAWAVARHAVVTWLGAGEQDPPGRLLRRTAGSAVAAPLRVLTGLYLPVRYGRSRATPDDAAAARAALTDVLAHTDHRRGREGHP